MSSLYIWVANHLSLTLLIFLNIIKKKHDSSAEFFVRISIIKHSFCILLTYYFLLSFSAHFSGFSYSFVFFL